MKNEIEAVSKVSSGKSESIVEKGAVEPNREHFERLVDQETKETQKSFEVDDQQMQEARKASLMEEITKLNDKTDNLHEKTNKHLVVQAREVIAQIDQIKEQLQTPQLELRGSMKNLLRSKLTHIDESLKIALSKAGVEYKPQQLPEALETPIERFLGFLSHGQSQLETLASDVEKWHQNKEEISPAKMLLVQIKVNYVQQELELFANLLNKTLESTKTIMNVQI